jgi:hypothetical protein
MFEDRGCKTKPNRNSLCESNKFNKEIVNNSKSTHNLLFGNKKKKKQSALKFFI